MKPSRTRVLAVTGATLALVTASTAVVTAHPGRHDDRDFGPRFGLGRLLEPFVAEHIRLHEGPFALGRMGLGSSLGLLSDALVRTEITIDRGDDGIVTHRADSGSVTSATEGALEYTLATGESATVTVGDDTRIWALRSVSEDVDLKPFHGPRLTAEEIAAADIAVGNAILVSATSQEDGSFLAHRIVVKPSAEVTGEADEATTDEAPDGPAADAAPVTGAPATEAPASDL